jgi:hypothetical protein
MKTNVIIIDDFYTNPHEVRQFAMSQEFKVRGNYPGARTLPMLNDSIKNTLQNILNNAGGLITYFPDDGYNGSFQTTYAWDKSWIHSDHFNTWAGVCYLTPDAPLSGGTATYQHKKTGARSSTDVNPEMAKELDSDGSDRTKWETVDSFGNIFNRLVLYRGHAYHMSRDYFGKTFETCRLFQVFFFNTEH